MLCRNFADSADELHPRLHFLKIYAPPSFLKDLEVLYKVHLKEKSRVNHTLKKKNKTQKTRPRAKAAWKKESEGFRVRVE